MPIVLKATISRSRKVSAKTDGVTQSGEPSPAHASSIAAIDPAGAAMPVYQLTPPGRGYDQL